MGHIWAAYGPHMGTWFATYGAFSTYGEEDPSESTTYGQHMCDSFTVSYEIHMHCVSTDLGVHFVVQLLSLSPVLSPILWSLLYNIELVFMFSVLFLVFWNKIASRCRAPGLL